MVGSDGLLPDAGIFVYRRNSRNNVKMPVLQQRECKSYSGVVENFKEPALPLIDRVLFWLLEHYH